MRISSALFAAHGHLHVRGEEHQNNMPAQVEISEGEDEYKILFIAGGGSANKAFCSRRRRHPDARSHDLRF